MSERSPRLYLVSPPAVDAEGFGEALAAALAAGDVACLLLALEDDNAAAWGEAVRLVKPLTDAAGVALLLLDRTSDVVALGADGAHVEASFAALKSACATLRPKQIVGAGGMTDRHHAMQAGELEPDYVLFGTLAPGQGGNLDTQTVMELTEWWAELFELPCVALAGDLEEARQLAASKADFVALGAWVWEAPAGAAAIIGELAGADETD